MRTQPGKTTGFKPGGDQRGDWGPEALAGRVREMMGHSGDESVTPHGRDSSDPMMPKRAKLFKLSIASVLLLGACVDSAQSPPGRPDTPAPDAGGGGMLAPLDLVYVCGNRFLATNSTNTAVEVEYRVAGTGETGRLTLREGPGGDPGFSETEFETSNTGVVELYHDDARVARRTNESLACGAPAASVSLMAAGSEAIVGSWS